MNHPVQRMQSADTDANDDNGNLITNCGEDNRPLDDGAATVAAASSFDSASSSSDEESESNGLSLAERRALKVERNNALLESLGLIRPNKRFPFQGGRKKPHGGGANKKDSHSPNVEEKTMLLPSLSNAFDFATFSNSKSSYCQWHAEFKQHLLKQFPGRSLQVQQLMSLLVWSHSDANPQTSIPPIFVTGPHGSGKTAITTAICERVVARAVNNETTSSRISSDSATPVTIYSYLNIATQGNSWIGQIRRDVEQKLGLKKSKRRRLIAVAEGRDQSKNGNKKQRHNEEIPETLASQEKETAHASGPRRSTRTAASGQRNNRSKKERAKTTKKGTTKLNATAQDMFATTQEESILQQPGSSGGVADSTRSIAVHALGRFLQSTLLGSARMILVLDQAELLLDESLVSASTNKPNVLAQLLLLQQNFDLPLSIVVISNSILLGNSRLNRMVESSRSFFSMIGNIQPIQVHFPAYHGTHIFRTIIHTARVSKMITGESQPETSASFQSRVYKNFVHFFVNTMYDSVQDMNELIRMARLLWPVYRQPLHPDKIQQTFQNTVGKRNADGNSQQNVVDNNEQQGDPDEIYLLEYLDRKALPQFRQARDSCLSCLTLPPKRYPTTKQGTASAHGRRFDLNQSLSRQARYFFLAAYLCQVNRPEQDRSLFSIQKNGRRRKQALNEDNTTAMGGGNDTKKTASTIRLRSFPLERLLSIYVSLVALHSIQENEAKNSGVATTEWNSKLLSQLEERVGEWVTLLVDIGVLKSSFDGIRLSETRYSCHATAYEAEMVAGSLGFPLDRYTL